MKFYILHEAHSLCDYNDQEVFKTYESAKKFFDATKASIETREQIEDVYRENDDDYYVQVDGESIRLYITEHQL
jgi:hypothetical protein